MSRMNETRELKHNSFPPLDAKCPRNASADALLRRLTRPKWALSAVLVGVIAGCPTNSSSPPPPGESTFDLGDILATGTEAPPYALTIDPAFGANLLATVPAADSGRPTPGGVLVFNESGDAVRRSVTGGDIADGSVAAADLSPAAVTTISNTIIQQLAGGVLDGAAIRDGTLRAAAFVQNMFSTLAVDQGGLPDNSIHGAKLIDGTIHGAKIIDGTITPAKLAFAITSSGTLAAGAGLSLATAGGVSTVSIATGGVTQSMLSADAIAAIVQQVTASLAGAITSTEIADGSITGADIQDGAITSADIQDESLTGADVQNGSLTGSDIQDGSLSGNDIQDGSIGVADLGTDSVTSSQIATNAVGVSELADNSVDSAAIIDGQVMGPDLAAGAVGPNAIAPGAVGEAALSPDILSRIAPPGCAQHPDITAVRTPATSGLLGGEECGDVTLRVNPALVLGQSPSAQASFHLFNGQATNTETITLDANKFEVTTGETGPQLSMRNPQTGQTVAFFGSANRHSHNGGAELELRRANGTWSMIVEADSDDLGTPRAKLSSPNGGGMTLYGRTEGGRLEFINEFNQESVRLDTDANRAGALTLNDAAANSRVSLHARAAVHPNHPECGSVILRNGASRPSMWLGGDTSNGASEVFMYNGQTGNLFDDVTVNIDAGNTGQGGFVSLFSGFPGNNQRMIVLGHDPASNGGRIAVNNGSGTTLIEILGDDPAISGNDDAMLRVCGTVRARTGSLTGGCDVAETFEHADDIAVTPGMVMAIDPENAGKLTVSSQAYDKRVAGIISGAGDLKPGVKLGQRADGSEDNPLALAGRVYCYVDATVYAVEVGDMLTTSDTPGHAMKAVDHDRAFGAVLGKAMTPLGKGERGLVLVLVSLQ